MPHKLLVLLLTAFSTFGAVCWILHSGLKIGDFASAIVALAVSVLITACVARDFSEWSKKNSENP